MELRSHPLMSYHSVSSWPPSWIWTNGKSKNEVRGEIGVLKDVIESQILPQDRIFLIIDYKENEFMGCLLFNDVPFCRQIFHLLQGYRGRTIEHIGGIDLSHLL